MKWKLHWMGLANTVNTEEERSLNDTVTNLFLLTIIGYNNHK